MGFKETVTLCENGLILFGGWVVGVGVAVRREGNKLGGGAIPLRVLNVKEPKKH